MERILALLTEDPVLIARQMSDWESRGSVDLTAFQLTAIHKLMWSSSVFEQEIFDVIKEVKQEIGMTFVGRQLLQCQQLESSLCHVTVHRQ